MALHVYIKSVRAVLSSVLYGYELWFLVSKEEQRLECLKSVLRAVFVRRKNFEGRWM